MKRKSILIILAILLMTALTVVGTNHGQQQKRLSVSAQAPSTQQANSQQTLKHQQRVQKFERLAKDIIAGLISEDQFERMKLTDEETLEVFKQIRDKRGWEISDIALAETLKQHKLSKATAQHLSTFVVSGSGNQAVEMEKGNSSSSYPQAQVRPNPGECGSDKDDLILVYSTPKWPKTNPDNVRMWSDLWWVRTVVNGCYSWRYGGLLVNGLTSSTTRACIGSCTNWLKSDLNSLYFWHK